MTNVKIIFLSLMLLHSATKAETVYKCKNGNSYTYSATPCPGQAEKTLTTNAPPPDTHSIERLENQRLEYYRKHEPEKYNEIRRAQLTPEARALEDQAAEIRAQTIQREQSAAIELQIRQKMHNEEMAQRERHLMQEIELEQIRLEREAKTIYLPRR